MGHVWNFLIAARDRAWNYAERSAAVWVLFLLMTGMRRGESRTLKWSQINFRIGLIIVPIRKNYSKLVLPMGWLLRDLLAEERERWLATLPATGTNDPAPDGRVFRSHGKTGHIDNADKLFRKVEQLVRTLLADPLFPEQVEVGLHPHAMRRTLDDIAHEVGASDSDCRLLLNHVTQDVHNNNYANVIKKKHIEAMSDWINAEAKRADTPEARQMIEQILADEDPSSVDHARVRRELVTNSNLQNWRAVSADQLRRMVWNRPTVEIAQIVEISDSAVGKRCKALGITKPPAGYWNKVYAGKIDPRQG
ncbi:tyrosine-type recombinase/integrase [Variovorax sp. J22R133]|uniref:tyrosine-type recombinase/integrase n=1 Tax=Variovorax brevis TaxID=3053503 RepID=UPI002576539F|nr:tyrosine-type recombinase/integrase [Variovorax sp. J22R133]MDM0118075.1 tyrosine-type recombinase/integrase [Variovorax sp. J22R133]